MARSSRSRPFAGGSERSILQWGPSRPDLLKGRSAGDRMKVHRRHVLASLMLAAVPGGTAAPAASKVYRVGWLPPAAPLADTSPFGAPLVRGLAQHGYRQDHNLTFERRGAEGHVDQLPRLVANLVGSHVNVIMAIGSPGG